MSNLEGILESLEKLKTKYVIEYNYEKAAKIRELIIKIKEKIMAPHQERVISERDELKERTEKLGEFILNNPMFQSLNEDERVDMSEQHYFMSCYLEILNKRINRF